MVEIELQDVCGTHPSIFIYFLLILLIESTVFFKEPWPIMRPLPDGHLNDTLWVLRSTWSIFLSPNAFPIYIWINKLDFNPTVELEL